MAGFGVHMSLPSGVRGLTRRRLVTLALGATLAVVASVTASADGAAVSTLTHGRPIQVVSAASRGAAASTNWSGYAAYQSGTTFTDVKATWTQPSVTCPKRGTQYASFWVGLDGYNSNSVEQIGTDSDCVQGAAASTTPGSRCTRPPRSTSRWRCTRATTWRPRSQ